MRRVRVLAVAALASTGLAIVPMSAPAATTPPLRGVMYVGNNWAGTASIVDAKTMKVLRRGINLVPDKAEEIARINASPADLAYFLLIRNTAGEGHDQFVDDMFATKDGRYLAVSRPSLRDVVWINLAYALNPKLASKSIAVERSMDGYRTDHMALSPDGRRLLVSDSTAKKVIEFSMVNETLSNGTVVKLGQRMREFPSGETPHESNYTPSGSTILHASIGKVYTPGDDPALDAAKGDRWFQTVRNSDFAVQRRWDMGKELAESGHADMSAAVRPMALGSNGKIYFQVSFFHGLVEFDLAAQDANPETTYTSGDKPEPTTGRVTRVLPLLNRIPDVSREQYVNDSAHHGLAISADKAYLCVAGTMDDYVAFVNRATFTKKYFITSPRTPPSGTDGKYTKPYWSTEAPYNRCWVSLSGSDAVAVFDFATKQEVAYIAVGDHPQRIRYGTIVASLLG